jgi:DNA polymerase-1
MLGVVKKKKAEEIKLEKQKYFTYEDYPIEDLITYGGIDCLVTSGLLGKLAPKVFAEPEYTNVDFVNGKKVISKTKLMSIAESYERYTAEALEFILDLEINGMKYDVELNKVVKVRMEKEIAELEELIFNDIPKFNLDSGQQLGHYLYEVRGFTTERKTKTGELSTDGDTVKELAVVHPEEKWLPALAKRNDIASAYRTFVATYVEDFVKSDGRIHPQYNLHGTSSFRISGENPNLTQLPRPKHGYNLRDFFTVDKGNILICLDYSSAEVKILGALCKDPELLKAIELGMDFHSLSASKMYNINYDEFVHVLEDKQNPLQKEYKLKRQFSKALT